MSDWFSTLIVPAADAPLAREIAAALSSGGAGMWTTPLSADGAEPATHYVSSGWIPPEWQVMVPTQTWAQDETGAWVKTGETPGDPVAVYYAATQAGLALTQGDIDALFAVADVTEQEPFLALSRLGLQIVQPSEV